MITPGADSHDSYRSSRHAPSPAPARRQRSFWTLVEPVVDGRAVVVAQRELLARQKAADRSLVAGHRAFGANTVLFLATAASTCGSVRIGLVFIGR